MFPISKTGNNISSHLAYKPMQIYQLKIIDGDRVIDLPTPQKIELGFGLPIPAGLPEAFEATEAIVPVVTVTFNKSLFKQNNA